MKTVAILQSNYIPWKGYFKIIKEADVFVYYDSVQFTKNDWRNRNQIQTPNGPIWLTIPVGQKISRAIDEVEIPEHGWQKKHYKSIKFSYQKTKYFADYDSFLQATYLEKKWLSLSEINHYLIEHFSHQYLNLGTQFVSDRELEFDGSPTEKLVQIVQQLGGTRYLSGPAAKDYLEEEKFKQAGIELVYVNYKFPTYDHSFADFSHNLSVLDLLFHCGSDANSYLG